MNTYTEISELIASGHTVHIVSGEGSMGSIELYDGKPTLSAVFAHLIVERCGGDRWARGVVLVRGREGVNVESGEWEFMHTVEQAS